MFVILATFSLSVHKKDLKEFVREIALKNEEKPVKAGKSSSN